MKKSIGALWLCGVSSVAFPGAVYAQAGTESVAQDGAEQEAAAGDNGEIIVTARRRDEKLIDVPVAITALSGADITRSAINGTDALARKIPGLVVGEGGGTVQGGSIALRGISAADPTRWVTRPFHSTSMAFRLRVPPSAGSAVSILLASKC